MLLGIDTCGATGSIALANWDGTTVSVVAEAELTGRTFAAQLVPHIRLLLQENGAVPEDLKTIVVIHGPGSFTGVRIGVSTAKGLAEALGIPIVALSRLALLAQKAPAQKAQAQMAAIDAGRKECYFGSYESSRAEEILISTGELSSVNDPIAVCETGLTEQIPTAILVNAPTAAEALLSAAVRLKAAAYDDIAILDGNYVRRTDAELFARPAIAK